MEKQVREAIISELKRQAEAKPESLKVATQEDVLTVNGEVDIDELVMAVTGSLAGGP